MTTLIILSAINLAVAMAIYFRLTKKSKKSKPTYTEKDITAFGNYLLSDRRKNRVYSLSNLSDKEVAEEVSKSVTDADYQNWRYDYVK